MATTTTTNDVNFPRELATEVFGKVNGHSSLAKLGRQMPVPFAGIDIMTFNLDNEVSIVGEGGAKPAGSAVLAPVTMKPVKVVYQHRVTDEFLHMTDEKKISIMTSFTDGFAKKIATGFDIMGMHGVNPYDLKESAMIAQSLDKLDNTVSYTKGDPVAAMEGAVAAVGDYDVTGYVFSKPFAADLGKYAENKTLLFPEFRLGGKPDSINGVACDINNTVTKTGNAVAYAGDFENAFRWGYSENVTFEVIEYGDPDGLGDLKRHNQIVLRAEAYIGWAILDETAFCKVTEG